MRKIAAVLALAFLATPALGQDEGHSRNRKDPGQAYRPWKNYNKPGTVQWVEGLDEAAAKAAKEGKLLLVVNLVGEMKFEGC